MALLKAAVIGLGNIGMGYDYDSENNSIVLTHAKAFYLHPEFQLMAGIDPSPEKRDFFEKKYKTQSYPNVENFILNSSKPDVVAVAVPSNHHKDIFVQVAELGIKNIICEKPMSNGFNDAKIISDISQQYSINTLINYIRRFDPAIIQLKDWLKTGQLGVIEKIHVWYTGDYWVNASHFLDLIFFLIEEEPDKIILTSKSLRQSPDFFLRFNSGLMAYFNSAKPENFELFEVEIICESGRLTLLNGGRDIRIEKTVNDQLFQGYRILKEEQSLFETNFSRTQYHVLDSFFASIKNKCLALSNPETALKTNLVLQRIKDQLN